jgi:cell division protein FtsQ
LGERPAVSGGAGGGGTGTRTPRTTGGGVVVDPRMRWRRIQVRRDEGRRRLRRLTTALALLVAVVAAVAATRSPLLDVDRVTVSGAERTGDDEVRRAAAVEPGTPLISVDTGAVAERVERLPWVGSARVVRRWPSTLEIQVTERVPVAVVQVTEDRAAIVDAEGWVLAIEERAPDEEVPEGERLVLTGISGRVAEGERLEEAARDALDLAVALEERLPGVVASVSTELEAELVAGGVVRFGSTEHLDAKVTALKTVLDEVDTSCMEVLDVRVPGSPALTRNQMCS